MQKYYCERCRLIYSEQENCNGCGALVTKKIHIEVQKHGKSK